MIRAPRLLTLALAPLGAAALLSLHACDRLFPEHPLPGAEPAKPAGAAKPGVAAELGDHGDTPAAATRIRQGTPLTGSFQTPDDVDYFKVEVTTGTHLYVSTDQGNPQHAPTIVGVEGPGDAWSDNDQDVLVKDAVPGTYYIKVQQEASGTTSGTDYHLAVWLIGPPNETFDIQLRYVGDAPTDAQKRVFEAAAAFWESALRESERTIPAPMNSSADRCDGTPSHFGELVDDLLINVQLDNLGGTQSTLAQGGYCIHRLRKGQPDLPVVGIVIFDTNDVGRVEREGWLYHLAIHEMAHALGFGMDLWRDRGYLQHPTVWMPSGQGSQPPPDTHFTGPRALREFNDAGGTSYAGAKVPVENNTEMYAEGSLNAHWRESVFESEVMTAGISGKAPISRVTLGSLEDLGYAVNYDVADRYHLPKSADRSLLRSATAEAPAYPGFVVADDRYPQPPRPLELPGELVEILASR